MEWRVESWRGEIINSVPHTNNKQHTGYTTHLAINRPSLGGDVNTRSTARAAAYEALALCATGHAEATLLTRLKICR